MTPLDPVLFVGATAMLDIPAPRANRSPGDIAFEVTIVEVRNQFGRTDVLVAPVAGVGQQWVSSQRVTMKAL